MRMRCESMGCAVESRGVALRWRPSSAASWSKVAAVSIVLFFFSSRRRHTRFKCDWSSDVCSSDLAVSLSEVHPQVAGVSIGDYEVQVAVFVEVAGSYRSWDDASGQGIAELHPGE